MQGWNTFQLHMESIQLQGQESAKAHATNGHAFSQDLKGGVIKGRRQTAKPRALTLRSA